MPMNGQADLILELRRGAIVLAVLCQLEDEQYGYSLKRVLAAAGFDVEEGTLYPLMRRLESQGLLTSRWVLEESRPRRYYRISPAGRQVRDTLTTEWIRLNGAMKGLLPNETRS